MKRFIAILPMLLILILLLGGLAELLFALEKIPSLF